MSDIRLTIDDREVVVPDGATILDAARKAGCYVPALCDHPDLKPIGSCKLCIVQVMGMDCYPTACNTLALEGTAKALVRVGDAIPSGPGVLTILGPPAAPYIMDGTG